MSRKAGKRRKRKAKEEKVLRGFEEKFSKATLWIMFASSAVIVVSAIIGLMWFMLTQANFSEILRI